MSQHSKVVCSQGMFQPHHFQQEARQVDCEREMRARPSGRAYGHVACERSVARWSMPARSASMSQSHSLARARCWRQAGSHTGKSLRPGRSKARCVAATWRCRCMPSRSTRVQCAGLGASPMKQRASAGSDAARACRQACTRSRSGHGRLSSSSSATFASSGSSFGPDAHPSGGLRSRSSAARSLPVTGTGCERLASDARERIVGRRLDQPGHEPRVAEQPAGFHDAPLHRRLGWRRARQPSQPVASPT